MNAITAMAGGVFDPSVDDDSAELRQLVHDIGYRSIDARREHHLRPEPIDDILWQNLEETGLSRLTSTAELEAGPIELAIVLQSLARHAGAVPVAETDLLAAWLAQSAGLSLPASGPLTVADSNATSSDRRICGVAVDVPWARPAAAIILLANTSDGCLVARVDPQDVMVEDGHNLASEPRDTLTYDLPVERFHRLNSAVHQEFLRRGAWARCVQIIGALDAAAALSLTHVRERKQFDRPLSKFQSVQHALAAMAGEIERSRAAVTLAVAAAADHGFAAPETDYAVTVAKVVLGRTVGPVATIAHQLHGAIGVTAENRLWLATMRAQSWITEFGSTVHHAQRLGRIALIAEDSWDVVVGNNLSGWSQTPR